MRIKELSAATGVPVDTIRHYEKAGLLRSPHRSDNNYRRYAVADAQRLAFIRNCRALDMSLDEVRELIAFLDHPQPDCSAVDRVIEQHLAHVRARLAGLQRLEAQLTRLAAACGAVKPEDRCGIVLALGSEAPATTFPAGRGVHTT